MIKVFIVVRKVSMTSMGHNDMAEVKSGELKLTWALRRCSNP
jgi:hypothetical protein